MVFIFASAVCPASLPAAEEKKEVASSQDLKVAAKDEKKLALPAMSPKTYAIAKIPTIPVVYVPAVKPLPTIPKIPKPYVIPRAPVIYKPVSAPTIPENALENHKAALKKLKVTTTVAKPSKQIKNPGKKPQ